MFKYWSIKKYGCKLLPQLEKRYGKKAYYSPHQVRATVYQCDFSPKYLPLGYLLFTQGSELNFALATEFPELDIHAFKNEILTYLETKSYKGYILTLQQSAA